MSAQFDVAEVFRDEWPLLVARLVRDFGDLGLAEDAAQEAFFEATRRWDSGPLPDAPAAWLLTTGRRKAIDQVRRSKRLSERLADLAGGVDQGSEAAGDPHDHLVDDQLSLLLGCCHPALSFEAQVALTLRIVAGLSSAQIARAFLVTESTMTRRLTRSKTKIRATNIPFTTSNLETLQERLPAVCAVVYSIFAEGHTSTHGPVLLRGDLCDEAIWLGTLLRRLVPLDAEVVGLVALMRLTDARRASRIDADGRPVLLADQDRSQWNSDAIAAALDDLAAAHSMGDIGQYQLQAAIAALHATATTFSMTDWAAIVGIYDQLLKRQPSALIGLNRAIAIAERDGAAAGLSALEEVVARMPFSDDLKDYHYFHCARGEMLATTGRFDEAHVAFERAMATCSNEAERRHIALRLVQVREANHS